VTGNHAIQTRNLLLVHDNKVIVNVSWNKSHWSCSGETREEPSCA